MSKKVLIITYYWPPSGGPGVQRVLKFCKYLPKFGWEPIVLTVENGEYPAIDEKLIDEVPKGLKVYKTKTLEFFSLFKKLQGQKKEEKINTFELDAESKSLSRSFLKWVRSNFFIPDGRVGWKRFGFARAKQIIEKENINLIFTSSPPHSLQLIGLDIKNNFEIPWVADFRDPWTTAFWEQKTKRMTFASKKNQSLERKVIMSADHIVGVGRYMLQELFNDLNVKHSTIYNGFDQEDFKKVSFQKAKKKRIVYTGSIARTQVPLRLLEAIQKISESEQSKIEINFYGKYDQFLVQKVKAFKLEDTIHLNGYISHEEVIQNISNADLLLLLLPDNGSKGILTGKFFEYIGSGNPILAIGPKDSEVRELMQQHSLGSYCSYEEDLQQILKTFIEDDILSISKKDKDSLDIFKREHQAMQLAEIFNEYVE